MVNRVKVLFVIGLLVGAAGFAVALDLAGSDGVEISDGVPISSPNNNTVTIYGNTNISLENFAPSSDTVNVTTEDGNMTVTSAGDTRVGVQATSITGSKTRLTNIISGGTWIEVNPEDKNPIEFRGGLNELHWATTFDLNNRVEDLYISGPDGTTGTVRYSNFPADTNLKAVDVDTDTALDTAVSDSSGQATFDISLSSHSVSFESYTTNAPVISNQNPTGTIRTDSPTLEADIDDSNFGDGETVDVTFYLNGSSVHTESISSAQTVSTNVAGLSEGSHNFTVHAEDSTGLKTTNEESFTVEHYTPQPDNGSASPTGTTNFESNTLSIDVSDGDFPIDGDTVTVNWFVDGSQVNSETITSNQTVSYTTSALADGDHTWHVELSDTYGNSQNSQTFTYTIQHFEPNAENLQPEGGQSTRPNTVSADISDADFPKDGDSLTVEIYIDNTLESTQTITSNQTVSTAIPSSADSPGQHSYTYNVTDSYGYSINASETWENPGYLKIYNETVPHGIINHTGVNATVTGSFGSVDRGSTSDGTFNFSGLPPSETYVFTLNADGYHSRSFFVEDIHANRTAFLLSTSEASVANRITVSDRTGRFQDGTAVLIDRVINTSEVAGMPNTGPEWVPVAGDRLGAAEFFDVDLEEGARYRFRVRNEDGDIRILSEYSAKSDGQIELKIGSISYTFGDIEGYQWDVSSEETTGGDQAVTFAYNDTEGLTSQVNVEIQYRENGTVIDSATFDNGPYGEVTFTTTISNQTWNNNDFELVWNAQRDGGSISGNRILGGNEPLELPIDGLWKAVSYALTVFVIAFLVGAGAGPAAGIIAVGMWSGFAVYIELAPPELGAGATLLVLAIGAIVKAKQSQPQV